MSWGLRGAVVRDWPMRVLGWRATMLHGDPCVVDRWAFVRRHMRGGPVRTLDAGAGNGGFVMLAASVGNTAVGLSFSPDELSRAERRAELVGLAGAEFRVGDLRELDRLSEGLGTFDQILCLEVIEHLIEDELLIRRLASLLRPGGRLMISTPSDNHHPLHGEGLSKTEDGGHVRWGYSSGRLADLVRSAGLTLVEQGAISGIVTQKLTNLQRRAQKLHPVLGWAVVLPLRPLQLLDRPITRLAGWPYLCVTAVAEAQ